MLSPAPCNAPLDILWTCPLQVSRPYIDLDPLWQAMSPIRGDSPSCSRHGDGIQAALLPTAPCTPDTKIYPAATPKRMDSCPSSDAYTPTPSVSWQYCRDYTPSQPFCLRCSGGLPCRKKTSRNTAPLVSGTSWARQEGRNRCKRTLQATGMPSQSRPVPIPPPPPAWPSE